MISGLSDKLRTLRENYNYSQKQVAQILDVSPSLISSYETGERMPSIENLKALAQLYHCTSDFLLGLNCQESPRMIDVSYLNADQISAFRVLLDSIKK